MDTQESHSDTIPSTSERVPRHTDNSVNNKIHEETVRILYSIGHNRARVKKRLAKIEKEWDIERVLEANASIIALTSIVLGATKNKKWFAVTGVVATFLLQHSIQGWCPPVPLLRRLGFRTQREIDNERIILKARLGKLRKVNKDARTALDSL